MNKNICTIYLVRHGRTDWNDKRLIMGQTDRSLTKDGISKAEILAKELANIKLDKVYSSDLLRAKQTAQIIAGKHKLIVETSKSLRERYYAHLEGKHRSKLKEIDDALSLLSKDKRFSYKHHPDIESMEELMDRFLKFLRTISLENLGKTILVVSHGGPMWIFLSLLNYFDSQKSLIKINNLSFIKLESDGVNFKVLETKGINIVNV